jgi:hypothetical protein
MSSSIDDLVGKGEERRWDGEVEVTRHFHIDGELEFRWLLHW